MTADESLPRRFGTYLLTAELGQDALGRVFRALRLSGERGFVRLRIFESPEISEDSILDAIEENGEIHSFLKNPTIARGVQMDAVDGVPFLAWNETTGRTLDRLIAKAQQQPQGIPIEHALLIGEKVATALDHAYNTTVDGERTLHGLVWPGFVSLSDDGETRLTGFGLAAGFFPSLARPRFAREIAPYLAPEERANLEIGKNSDVYSVGVLLFELLFGRLPSPTDPLGDVKAMSQPGGAAPPEAMAVLRTCLSPAESRYQSSGDVRRELGKILFSGPYSPSTFNLAFFITNLFGTEIEAENRARSQEATFDAGSIGEITSSIGPAALEPEAQGPGADGTLGAARRRSYAIGGALLLAAALTGTIMLITRRPSRVTRPVASAPARPTQGATPTPEPTSPPTANMSESQFKEEVARRVAAELKKLDEEMQKSRAAAAAQASRAARLGRSKRAEPAPEPTPASGPPARQETAAAPLSSPRGEPTTTAVAILAPTVPPPAPVSESRPAPAESAGSPEENVTPPKIRRVIKPIYPPPALRARIGGIVLLRVLVSETGRAEDVQVLRGVGGGLTEAAASAVRKWTFEPASKNGQPIRAWTTIPIPFEP